MVPANTDRSTTARRLIWAMPVVFLGTVVISGLAIALALGGVDLGCLGGGGGRANAAGPAPTRSAVAEIPRDRLRLYRLAGRRFDIDWAFLASIGAQECDHGICAGDNGYGCAGPMQISMRRGSPCSPGSGPTLWEIYGVDGNGDGQRDVNDPADAIPTAARILRQSKGAPPVGGTYAQYRQAACNYYGACGDAVAAYADTVMARAIGYGFRSPDSPPPDTGSVTGEPRRVSHDPATDCGGAGGQVVARGSLGPVKRLTAPRRLAPLPASIVAPGFGPISCDARIVENVVYLARRFRQWVTACAAIHSLAGEHPLGAAIDTVPNDGNWDHTERLARTLGWRESCAASGVAPACANRPFRAVLYNGFPGHGDPAHCPPPGCGAHLHLSWMTSASQGQPESAARTSLFSPSWVEVFTITDASGESGRRGGRRA